MSEEFEGQVNEQTATGAEIEGASPTSEQVAEPQQEISTEPAEERKDGVQTRIDELTRLRRDAERERDYYRDLALAGLPQPDQPRQSQVREQTYADLPEPQEDDPKYETYGQWVKDHHRWSQQVAQRQATEEHINRTKMTWNQQGVMKYPDWEEVLPPHGVPITEIMGYTIMDSEKGHDIAYYLGKNRQEAFRIANLPAHRQAYEIGKLESRLSGPPQKTKTQAPVPTAPVGGKEVPTKKLEDMSYEEYKAFRERQLYGGK